MDVYNHNYPQPQPMYYVLPNANKRYRFRTFLWDLFMLSLTGGYWLIWIIIREIKRNR